MLGFDPQGHRDDCPNPVHEVVPLQVQQNELLGGLCKVGLQPQDAEQREHHLRPVANGRLQAQGTTGHQPSATTHSRREEGEDQIGPSEEAVSAEYKKSNIAGQG